MTRVLCDRILFHGDAIDLLPTIRGVHLCVTDPPYLLTSGGCTQPKYGGNRMSGAFAKDKYRNNGNFFKGMIPKWSDFMPLIYDSLATDAHAYFMADSKNQLEMQQTALAAGFRFHNLLYWDKGTCTTNRWYMKNAEYVGFFFKGRAFSINDCGSKQGIYIPHQDQTEHPTEKPVALMRYYIRNSSRPGQTVLDPFMGTDTTGVAAILEGRHFIGIERDKEWFDIAQRRIAQAKDDFYKTTPDLFN